MNNIVKALLSVVLVVIGSVGLYLKIEYSGWALGAGLAVALSLD